MIKVEKVGDITSPDIRIYDEINSFIIARNNLPDPCWYPDINYFTNSDDITFTIKEEDENIYMLFDKLYQDVIYGNVFPLTEEYIKDKSLADLKKLKQQKKEGRARLREKAQKSGLVSNGVITWHSDDYDAYDFASVLTIKKVDKQIKITFSKNKVNPDEDYMRTPPTYNVRITESGGRYWPFFMIFVNFHHHLQVLESEDPNLTMNLIFEEQGKTYSKR